MGVAQRAAGSIRRHVPTAADIRRAIDAPTMRDTLLPATPGPQVAEDALVQRVLDLCLRVGEVQLATGAGAAVAHDTMLAIAGSYGLPVCDVDIAFSTITMCCHRGVEAGPVTTMRNVRYRTQDYTRLAEVDDLIKEIVDRDVPITVDEAFERLATAVDGPHPYPRFVAGLARSAFAGAVALLLSGGGGQSWTIAGLAFVLTGTIWGAARWLGRRYVPLFFQQVTGAVIVTTVASLLASFRLLVDSPALVVAAGLVALLSGLSLVGLVQDAISGFPITAAGRAVEVVLSTAGLLVGVVVAIKLVTLIGGPAFLSYVLAPAALAPGLTGIQLAAAAAAGLFFALSAYAPLPSLPWAALSGVLTWAAYAYLSATGLADALAATLAAGILGLVAMCLPRRLGLPPLVLVVAGITPLLPGLTFYRGFTEISQGATAEAAVTLVLALTFGLALAAGVSFGEQVGWPLQKALRRALGRGRHREALASDDIARPTVHPRRPRIF